MKRFLMGSLSVAIHSGFVLAAIGILNRTQLGRTALGTDYTVASS
jgi:hypothetical protein